MFAPPDGGNAPVYFVGGHPNEEDSLLSASPASYAGGGGGGGGGVGGYAPLDRHQDVGQQQQQQHDASSLRRPSSAAGSVFPVVLQNMDPADFPPHGSNYYAELPRSPAAVTPQQPSLNLEHQLYVPEWPYHRKPHSAPPVQIDTPPQVYPGWAWPLSAELHSPNQTPTSLERTAAAVEKNSRPLSANPDTLSGLPAATLARQYAQPARRKMSMIRRGMTMRGAKPQILKVRVVKKADNKSYFSVERTTYKWVYMSTALLGTALTFFAVEGSEAGTNDLARRAGTLMSVAALVVMYYAAFFTHRRRRALDRLEKAAAFDDQVGPVAIVAIVVCILAIHQVLAFRDVVIELHKSSFVFRPGG